MVIYMGVFNDVNNLMEKDVFGLVCLDEKAIDSLEEKMKEIDQHVPFIGNYRGCFARHEGVMEAVYCPECCPSEYHYE